MSKIKSVNNSPNKPISFPNRHSLPLLRVPRKLSTKRDELKA